MLRARALIIPVTLLATALVAPPLSAQVDRDNFAQRDTTRVGGTIYDSQGSPIPKVELWVMNDNAPADRTRGRARATGTYLVRGLGRLFTDRDMEGIMLRLTYSAAGYESVTHTIAAPVNNYSELFPILAKPGEDLTAMGWCLLLRGQVSRGGKKGIRDAAITVTSPDEPGLNVQATTEKDGTYEALLWNVPASLVITASSGGTEKTEDMLIGGEPVPNRVSVLQQDFSF